jgi:myosin XV
LAALQFKANDKVGLPNIREVKHLLPVNILDLNDLKPQQWVTLIHLKLKQIEHFTVTQAKSKFLEVLQSWPLFGSTFFYVKNIHDSRISGDCIIAINKTGILFLLKESHETILTFSFNEIISTRRYRGENNSQFVDLKYGNLMQYKVIRIESDQGNEMTTLIGQYINLLKKHEDSENELTTNL